MARKVSLEEWLAGAISDPDRPEGQGVTAFVMHHTLAGGKKGDFVHKHARGSGEWDVKKLTEILESKAAVFIQERQGRQVFRVYPFFGGKGESEGYFEFSKEREEEGVGTLTEEPDTRGQTSQTMRHNEAYASLLVSGLNQLMGNMLEHNKQLAQEASNLRHDNAQNFETMKGMVLESESRAHELRMKEMEFERTSVFYRKAMELAGPLANTLTGREIVPQSHADSQIFKAVVLHMARAKEGTMGGDGLTKFMEGMPQELIVAMISRADAILKEERQKQEEIRSMNPWADPAADAAGEVAGKMTLANGNGAAQP